MFWCLGRWEIQLKVFGRWLDFNTPAMWALSGVQWGWNTSYSLSLYWGVDTLSPQLNYLISQCLMKITVVEEISLLIQKVLVWESEHVRIIALGNLGIKSYEAVKISIRIIIFSVVLHKNSVFSLFLYNVRNSKMMKTVLGLLFFCTRFLFWSFSRVNIY